MQSIVRHMETKTDKISEREKNSIQFTREYLKYCDAEKYEEQKRSGKKKICKRKERKRDSCSSINGPRSRIYRSTIIGIQTQTEKVSFFKKDR